MDDQVVWDEDVAGHDNGIATVDLAKAVSSRPSVKLSVGIFDAKGVGNFGIEASFEELAARREDHGVGC